VEGLTQQAAAAVVQQIEEHESNGTPTRARICHGEALDWLHADLDAWNKLLLRDPEKHGAQVQQTLEHWQQDSDLEGIRDPAAVEKMPDAERRACEKLWADVGELLTKVKEK